MTDICRQALEAGYISQEEDDDLFRADLVVHGSHSGELTYVVIEASLAAGAHDFERADHRAEILAKAIASGAPAVLSVVVSESLQAEVDPSKYRATHITLAFRREDYQAAIAAMDAAVQAAAVGDTGPATPD